MRNFLFLFVFTFFQCQKEPSLTQNSTSLNEVVANANIEKAKVNLEKLKSKADEAFKFVEAKKYNAEFCILVDMSLHSGVNRFFVWDFAKQEISHQFLVGHGCGSASWSSDDTKENPSFSNVDGSHLSSLGKYKLGARGTSEWGIGVKYLMHGLEENNSNALPRFIVFHSWNLMSDAEVYPKGSPEGWGCPTISNNALKTLDPMLQKSKKPVLFWMYN